MDADHHNSIFMVQSLFLAAGFTHGSTKRRMAVVRANNKKNTRAVDDKSEMLEIELVRQNKTLPPHHEI
jgi:hypothetical protein